MSDQAPTYTATIFLAGDLAMAKQVCREFCYAVGLCVTVEPTTYIYTGGEEAGVRVGLINYPRFPAEPEAIRDKAFDLANLLREALCQHSWTVLTPEETYWDRLPETPTPADAARSAHRDSSNVTDPGLYSASNRPHGEV